MSAWNVVVSGSADSTVPARLAGECGLTILAIPDLHDLPPKHAVYSAINELPGGIAVAAPYPHRATYWMLAAGGVDGDRADIERPTTNGRPVRPIDIARCDDAEAAERILAITGRGDGQGIVRDLSETLQTRWYPVIDYDRCTNCRECVEFCLFGVYELDGDGRTHVAIGDNCKPGCPACARVCPAKAIIFPRYPGEGEIAGHETGGIEYLSSDDARKMGATDVKDYVARYGDPDKPRAAEVDDLDQVVDDLESFDG